MEINEKIHIEEYNPEWVLQYEHEKEQLRDFLRNNKDEAMRYSEVKKAIISQGVDNLLEYSERKANFINEILKKANQWYNNSSF